MALAAPSERRWRPRPPTLRGLLWLCLWLPGGRAPAPPSAPLSELHAQLSGVEQLLEEVGRQLQPERPRKELEPELRPQRGCPGPGGLSAMPGAIIRTKDSIAAGASFLRAPAAARDWRQCVEACCSEPRCSVAVVELPPRPAPAPTALRCYLFDCTARGRSVCRFAVHRGYSSYSLGRAAEGGQRGLDAGLPATARAPPRPEKDEPPLSKAGQDVVLRLPEDTVILDGRESTDDLAIIQYEWTLLQGDPSMDMKVPQSGTLKLSHLQEGTYTFQLTVTDTAGQRSSDIVSVTVLPMVFSTGGCLKVCSRYHFFCDDGCCIDITLACNGVEQCPDGSDEAFCQNLNLDRKMVTHVAPAQPGTTGLRQDAAGSVLFEKPQKATAPNWPATLSDTEKRNHSTVWGPKSQIDPVMPEFVEESPNYWFYVGRCARFLLERHDKARQNIVSLLWPWPREANMDQAHCPDPLIERDSGSSGKNGKEENYIFESKSDGGGVHPAPETGAVLPLALGLAITALLLLLVACRLRLVKQKLKKARPITSEESDYLINGMYL